jgi:hypothetical protein
MPSSGTFHHWLSYIRDVSNCGTEGILKKNLGDWLVHPQSVLHIKSWLHTNNTHIIINKKNNDYVHLVAESVHGLNYYNLKGKKPQD